MTTWIEDTYERSGYASLRDLDSARQQSLFSALEEEQRRFLVKEQEFRSDDYRWPRDALHNWSRVWEYPYVYHHVTKLTAGGAHPQVMDLGSGLTFFPYALARAGARVTCVDIDPIAGRDLARASKAHGVTEAEVSFRQTDGKTIPVADASFDAVYCVSVLEHVPDPAALAAEVARTLKPGGRFILTIDVAIEGRTVEIQADAYEKLLVALAQHFRWQAPERPVHPTDLLLSNRGPYAQKSSNKAKDLARRAVNGTLKHAFGFERGYLLAVHAFVLEKPAGGTP